MTTEEQLRARVAMLEEALRLPHVVTRSTQCWCEDSLRTTHDKTCREMRAALTSSDPSAWLAEREARAAAAEHDRIYKSLRNDGKLLTPEREAQVRREALEEATLEALGEACESCGHQWCQSQRASAGRIVILIDKSLWTNDAHHIAHALVLRRERQRAATPSEPTPKRFRCATAHLCEGFPYDVPEDFCDVWEASEGPFCGKVCVLASSEPTPKPCGTCGGPPGQCICDQTEPR